MNRSLIKKMHSERGASITFALLLFLVCAVLSSVTIAAATTAAGRMANMAQADQRYYSVTSACELLEDLIDGKTVTILTQTTTLDYFDETREDETQTDTVLIPDKNSNEAVTAFNSGNTEGIIPAPNSIVTYAAYKYFHEGELPYNKAVDISIECSGIEDFDDDSVKPDIEEKIKTNGDIIMNVKKDGYVMVMDFVADVNNSVSTLEENIKEEEVVVGKEIITTETIELKWSLASIAAA